MPKPRAYLIDSSIYIFRAWHLYDGRHQDSDGQLINALTGFCDFLWHFIRNQRPDALACAFDESQTESFRREIFPAYKAHREPAPTDLRRQFPLCRRFCEAAGIPSFGSHRFEADDLLGSLAARLRAEGYAITILSADKDLTQLLEDDEDRWWDYARNRSLDRRGVERQFGVLPAQIPDLLALSGDKADNIPGVPGIGYTLAARLLRKFRDIDDLLANLDAVARMKFRGATRVQALLRAHAAQLPRNRLLTTVVCDLPLAQDSFDWTGPDGEGLARFFAEQPMDALLRQRWRSLVEAGAAAPTTLVATP